MTQIQNHFETIANGLADRGFASIDQFLSSEEVKSLLLVKPFSDGSLRPAGIGKTVKQVNEGIRGDHIHWIDKETEELPLKLFMDRLDALRLSLNQNLYLSLKDYEGHLACYPKGTFYKRHLDQFKTDDHRKISVIMYLNENWHETDGGQLRLYLDEGHLDISPDGGKLVCFRSDVIEHEVLPAGRERLSITGWFLDQFSNLKHLTLL
jgi:SM-20-related protein